MLRSIVKRTFAIAVSAVFILCVLFGCGSPNVPSIVDTLHAGASVAELSMDALVDHADVIMYRAENRHALHGG